MTSSGSRSWLPAAAANPAAVARQMSPSLACNIFTTEHHKTYPVGHLWRLPDPLRSTLPVQDVAVIQTIFRREFNFAMDEAGVPDRGGSSLARAGTRVSEPCGLRRR